MNKAYLIHLAAGASYFTGGLIDHLSWSDKYDIMTESFDLGQDSAVITACEAVPALMAAFDYLVTDLKNIPMDVPAYEFWERLGGSYCELLDVSDHSIHWPDVSEVEALLRERLADIFYPDDVSAEDIEAAISRFRAAW